MLVSVLRRLMVVDLLRDDGMVVLQDDPFDVVGPQLLLLQVTSLEVPRTRRGQSRPGI